MNMNTDIIIIIILIIIFIIIIFSDIIDCFTNKWNDKIDGIIYINLEKRDDRKKLLLEELSRIEVDMNKVNKVAGSYIPKNGHKGCVQSHILALTLAKMNKWKYIMIFEDDMELNVSPDEFNTNVNDILDYMSNNKIPWDVIMLATGHGGNRKEPIENNNMFVKVPYATTSSGYIVNENYYDKLLEVFKNCNDNMVKDKWSGGEWWEPYALDQQWNKLQSKDNWYGFTNDLIKQRNISSTIMNRE